MTATLTRSTSPGGANGHRDSAKRIKLSSTPAFASATTLVDHAPALHKEFFESTPYLHCVAQDLFSDSLLSSVRNEIYKSLNFTLKETDIYRVYQTGDLANLDGLSTLESDQLASLKQLRDALYSKEFRSFLHSVTACGPLSGKQIDMSINEYQRGCHLLNHDDVIGTRRVSFILYLTDPQNPWTREDGGSLELYPVITPGTPSPVPSKTISPQFNQFTFFTVQPGHSFHSVEEVVSEDKKRLSISGWFHLPHEDEEGYVESQSMMKKEAETAQGPSLQQLTSKNVMTFIPLTNTEFGDDPDSTWQSDLVTLRQFIREPYLTREGIAKIRRHVVSNSHVELERFLNEQCADSLKRLILRDELQNPCCNERVPNHQFCNTDDWNLIGPPHIQRYLSLSSTSTTHPTLNNLATFFKTPSFTRYISRISNLTPLSTSSVDVRRFRPGLDYTLATSNEDSSTLIDVRLNLTAGLQEDWNESDVGGWECYIAPSTHDDPTTYTTNDSDGDMDSTLLTTFPKWNSLGLVIRDRGLLKFVKYVSLKAKECRWDVGVCYEIGDPLLDNDNEEDDDDEDDEE